MTTTTPVVSRHSARLLSLGLPFIGVHVACLAVIVVGWSVFAVAAAFILYMIRGFGITAFYHRLFSHHAFKTSRPVQFVGAWMASSAAQRGPLWWVAHHRRHHRVSDQPGDIHSPRQRGMGMAHIGWQFEAQAAPTHLQEVPDLARFPELRFLDRHHYLAPVSLALGTFVLGWALGHVFTGLTDGPQLLVWAFFVSTVAVYHVTFSVNSLAHRFGSRPHNTTDDSRNNWLVALVSLGEGWHNNHHRFPGTARHGFRRGQIDLTHFGLRVMRRLHLVWDLHPVPARLWLGRGAPLG
jgi:stearoyl-CoA desaturase (Delta-9 desaturase)